MDSSATDTRKLIPFVPDVPYHIQIVFLFTFIYIWYTAFIDDYEAPLPANIDEQNQINKANWWRGIISVIIFLCSFSYLRPQALDFFNPIQRFWRVVSMLALIYFCFIIIMLHHRPVYGRYLLGYLDSRLNQALTKGHHTYDDDCELTWENLADNFDHYYLVHLCNWFLSSFVIRDFYLLHFWHVLDEVIELSWQHILPHFRECWWDHIGCDILLSNIPAITFGLWLQKRLGLIPYDFWGKEGKKSILEWEIWTCHKKWGIMVYIQILLYIHFLTGFFLNNNLLIPPKHPFPVLRLLLWFGLGAIAFREGYEDARTWNTTERKFKAVEGRYRWLTVAILSTEAILCYKYRADTGHINFNAVTPWYIWVPWTLFFGGMIAFWLYLRFKNGHTTKYPMIQNQEQLEEHLKKSLKKVNIQHIKKE